LAKTDRSAAHRFTVALPAPLRRQLSEPLMRRIPTMAAYLGIGGEFGIHLTAAVILARGNALFNAAIARQRPQNH
jgi:hypothetical protein